jgi:uncharacterized protein (TIGR02452 family)
MDKEWSIQKNHRRQNKANIRQHQKPVGEKPAAGGSGSGNSDSSSQGRGRGKNETDPKALRASHLIEVYKDTVNACTRGPFKSLRTSPTELYEYMREPPVPASKYDKTTVKVVNGDTTTVVQELLADKGVGSDAGSGASVSSGSGDSTSASVTADTDVDGNGTNKVCFVNMASAFLPGGGVRKGCEAQEEHLFRVTTLFKTLDRATFYPFEPPNVLYSPNVWVVKDKEYNPLDKPFSAGCISAAMPRHPTISVHDNYAHEKDYLAAKRTIDHVFHVAYVNGYDTLVLGAMGCGAYRNPQMSVIELFNECLAKYNKCFKTIVFAVYDSKAGKKGKEEEKEEEEEEDCDDRNASNYVLFRKYISKSV